MINNKLDVLAIHLPLLHRAILSSDNILCDILGTLVLLESAHLSSEYGFAVAPLNSECDFYFDVFVQILQLRHIIRVDAHSVLSHMEILRVTILHWQNRSGIEKYFFSDK